MRANSVTLERFLEEEPARSSVTQDLSRLLLRFAGAGRTIARELAFAGLRTPSGAADTFNASGERQKRLDLVANEILLEAFGDEEIVWLAASEELEEPHVYTRAGSKGRYAVLFDPLDGSSNIGVNGTLGTIFSIRARAKGDESDLLRAGNEQIAAGYVLFGPAVLFVYSTGSEVHVFTLDPTGAGFLLTARRVRMPSRGCGYAVNEGRSSVWEPRVRAFVEHLKQAVGGRPYATRYSASLVADFHRILMEGGIYLYPADHSGRGEPTAKLRVLYECHPLAFVARAAGGGATTGRQEVLDVVPGSLHATIPFAIGSAEEIELYGRFVGGSPASGTR